MKMKPLIAAIAAFALTSLTGCNTPAHAQTAIASAAPVTFTATTSANPPYAAGQTINVTFALHNTNPASVVAQKVTATATVNGTVPAGAVAPGTLIAILWTTDTVNNDFAAAPVPIQLPEGLTLGTLPTGVTSTTTATGITLNWAVGTIAGGATATITVPVTFPAAVALGPYSVMRRSTAVASADSGDGQLLRDALWSQSRCSKRGIGIHRLPGSLSLRGVQCALLVRRPCSQRSV